MVPDNSSAHHFLQSMHFFKQKWTFDEPMVSPAPEKLFLKIPAVFISVMVSEIFLLPLNAHIGF